MNPEAIPKLRVIDSGASRTAATAPSTAEAPTDVAAGTSVGPDGRRWPFVLLFLVGALVGGVSLPLVIRLLWP